VSSARRRRAVEAGRIDHDSAPDNAPPPAIAKLGRSPRPDTL
jgi:hypothetical protein